MAFKRSVVRCLQLQTSLSCTFAQEPTNGDCLFTLVWQVHEGYYNDIRLDG
ncbi:DUF1326 domain-containing protein, partial [Bacillus cereus]|uniref:DUF1326 domain-containing protein n=1 Tax=Bacillus cereus TaxID=1396 RepID=UPI003BF7504F